MFSPDIAFITVIWNDSGLLTNNSGYFLHLIDTLMRQVRWFGPGQSLLFNGVTAVSSDRRFSLARPYPSYWNLVIKHVKVGDQGIYRCQVQYPVTLTREITLEVQGMELFLLGQHVTKRMTSCNVFSELQFQDVYVICLFCNFTSFELLFLSVAPQILPSSSSENQQVKEGSEVTIYCDATGFPSPKIMWHLIQDGKSKRRSLNWVLQSC